MQNITADTTDAELEAQVADLPKEFRVRRLIHLKRWRDMAQSHSTEEPTGLRESLGIN
jgi:hypothetical protein